MPFLDALWLSGAKVLPVLAQATGAGADTPAPPVPAAPGGADFQPYIFWSYGLACALLLVFGVWTSIQMRELRRRVDALQDRVQDASEAP